MAILVMTNLFKRIFSLFSASAETSTEVQSVEPVLYKGYLIYVTPRLEAGLYRVAGMIEKPAESPEQQTLQYQFIRSDLCMNQEQAAQITLKKCQLFIDQIGDGMFA